MKRYTAYDPPEYQQWRPEADVVAEFRQQLDATSARSNIVRRLTPETHLRLYRGLVRNRLHDIALKRWVRQGVISKAWLGTGEEAVTVGAVHALRKGDVVGPMIRNAGACHEMGMPLEEMFRAYLGTEDSPTRGREIHFGDLRRGVLAPISMVGSSVPICAGLALSFRIADDGRVALTWAGDGTTRTTAFHEGLTCARAGRLPLIVVVQDNQIALGTTSNKHSAAPLFELGEIYDVEAVNCEGNNVLDMYAATAQAVQTCSEGRGPVMLVARTFRMGGHATHDEGESRQILAPEQFAYWGRRDPIGVYEEFLASVDFSLIEGMDNDQVLKQAEAEVAQEVELAQALALESKNASPPRVDTQRHGVWHEGVHTD